METISQETRMISEKEFQHVAKDAQILGNETKEEIKNRYMGSDTRPWIVAYSGGKDSTLLTQLVFEAIKEVPPSKRNRKVYVLSSNTLVETPHVIELVRKSIDQMNASSASLNLPIETHLVEPDLRDTFWVRVVGYGYPPPSRLFRWCTDRMKIKPSNRFILDKVSEHGEVILLMGARSEESVARAKSLEKHKLIDVYNKHTSLPNSYVWAPIKHFSLWAVWAYLINNPSPWGGDNYYLREMYKTAGGLDGECGVVFDETTEPCGNSRFGCYTCTVVEKDRSLEGFVELGDEHFRPLLELREWLIDLREDPEGYFDDDGVYHGKYRSSTRRNGQPGKGPLKLNIREDVLEKLKEIQKNLGEELISNDEEALIKEIWHQDSLDK